MGYEPGSQDGIWNMKYDQLAAAVAAGACSVYTS